MPNRGGRLVAYPKSQSKAALSGEEGNVSKPNRGLKAFCALLLWAVAAVALPAQTFTTLHNFNKRAGTAPLGGLVQGSNGNFYGTTKLGGVSKHMFCTRGGCGIVFEIAPAGKLTVLHNFC
jgi:uncharacterized repeat protein (TIGR03803 family)